MTFLALLLAYLMEPAIVFNEAILQEIPVCRMLELSGMRFYAISSLNIAN